ncbi:unnamed protein product [Closterium sp. NIES-54]
MVFRTGTFLLPSLTGPPSLPLLSCLSHAMGARRFSARRAALLNARRPACPSCAPRPGAAASLCCPLLLSPPPFFISLLRVQPWNGGYGGGGYGGDGWCVSLPLLLLSFPLLQLPLRGGREGVGEPGEWHWGGGCETNQPPSL